MAFPMGFSNLKPPISSCLHSISMGFSMDFPRAFHVAGRGWRRAQLRLGGLWSGGGCVGEPILASTSVGKFRQDEGYPVGEWEKHRKSIQDGAPQIWLNWLKKP